MQQHDLVLLLPRKAVVPRKLLQPLLSLGQLRQLVLVRVQDEVEVISQGQTEKSVLDGTGKRRRFLKKLFSRFLIQILILNWIHARITVQPLFIESPFLRIVETCANRSGRFAFYYSLLP